MTVTLLLDLDDTLLTNSMATFIPAYLKTLAEDLRDQADPEAMINALLAGTRRMYANEDPTRTLKQTFDALFYPALGLDPTALAPRLARFYAEVFPRLRHLTTPRPAAQRLVAATRARGYRLVLASNPLFPRAAIVERLRWAGLDPAHFDLIPGYETFHFVKPHPAFFAELLAQLGCPEGPVVMVGNDPEDDIAAARRLGLPTYWVTDTPPQNLLALHGAGPLEGMLPWLESAPPESLLPQMEHREAYLYRLRVTPAALHTATATLPPAAWRRPDAQAWSLTEILCHLRDVEAEVHLPRLHRVLTEDNPFLLGVNADRWAEERAYCCQDGPEALARFAALRQETLALLQDLTPADWERPARHALLGSTHLTDLVGLVAEHDRFHLHQAAPLWRPQPA